MIDPITSSTPPEYPKNDPKVRSEEVKAFSFDSNPPKVGKEDEGSILPEDEPRQKPILPDGASWEQFKSMFPEEAKNFEQSLVTSIIQQMKKDTQKIKKKH